MAIFKKPQCLIYTEESGKLKINHEVVQELQLLDKPMVVVAITGLYRMVLPHEQTGRGSRGFALGSTIESKTKGIWIWVQPHPKETDTYIVLLDTEGLGDAQKGDRYHDNWILTLAVLLSSTFVYNFLGAMDDTMFSKLQFITEISKKIKIRKEDKEGDNLDFDLHFPLLIFTARDFYLGTVIDGKTISSEQYLEVMLAPDSKQSKDSMEARKCIRQYFVK